ncbi:MAG: hypothetical protein JOY92_04805 [Verrucomicrobia bacterium]|nr:hypothetical protein [Verrucomicrobiota bacterium]
MTAAIVAALSVAAIMNMQPQAASANRQGCMANLQMLEAAKAAWVADHPGQDMPSNPDDAKTALSQYVRGGIANFPGTCPGPGKTPYTNPPKSSSTLGMYDPTLPCYCPYHQQQAYATPTPTP